MEAPSESWGIALSGGMIEAVSVSEAGAGCIFRPGGISGVASWSHADSEIAPAASTAANTAASAVVTRPGR